MHKAVQYFSDDYLMQCKAMSTDQILEFIESFRQLAFEVGPLKQINLRVPSNVLQAFKDKAKRQGISYQLKVRELMTAWALS